MSIERGDFVRLKELRKKKGISQLRLATDLNTTQNTISRYETGERELYTECWLSLRNRQHSITLNTFLYLLLEVLSGGN